MFGGKWPPSYRCICNGRNECGACLHAEANARWAEQWGPWLLGAEWDEPCICGMCEDCQERAAKEAAE